MSETETAPKPLRLADLPWWRQWLAEPAVFWLEWVVPRGQRFDLTLDPVDGRTLSEEMFAEIDRRKRKRDADAARD